MRPPSMSGHFLLAPIPESSSDYLLPRDIKLAVLGASRVGKSGECLGDRAGRPPTPGQAGTTRNWGRVELAGTRGGQGRNLDTTTRLVSLLPGASTRGLSPRLAPVGEQGRYGRSSTCGLPRHQRRGRL